MTFNGEWNVTADFHPCPHLGCAEDRDSLCMYATGANVCYAAPGERRPYHAISRDRQRRHCLSTFDACTTYQGSMRHTTHRERHSSQGTVGKLLGLLRAVL